MKKQLIVALDVVSGVEGFVTVPKLIKNLWEAVSSYFLYTKKDYDYIWMPGDSIWIAADSSQIKDLNGKSMSLKHAIKLASEITKDVSDVIEKSDLDVRLAFAYGRANKMVLDSKLGFGVWLGHGLNIAGRVLKLYSHGGLKRYGAVPFGIEGEFKNIYKNSIRCKSPFQPIMKKYNCTDTNNKIYKLDVVDAQSEFGRCLLRGLDNVKKCSFSVALLADNEESSPYNVFYKDAKSSGGRFNFIHDLVEYGESNKVNMPKCFASKKLKKKISFSLISNSGKWEIETWPKLNGVSGRCLLVEMHSSAKDFCISRNGGLYVCIFSKYNIIIKHKKLNAKEIVEDYIKLYPKQLSSIKNVWCVSGDHYLLNL